MLALWFLDSAFGFLAQLIVANIFQKRENPFTETDRGQITETNSCGNLGKLKTVPQNRYRAAVRSLKDAAISARISIIGQ
jgi:hypothetical protein